MDFDNNCIFSSSIEQWSVFVNILLSVLLSTTLKPNGKFSGNFVWIDLGLTNSSKESNTLNASVFIQVRSLLSGYLYSFSVNSAQSPGKKKWKCD